MTRRLILALVAVAALAASMEAQQLRLRKRPPLLVAPSNPVVTITGPTSETAYQTTATSVSVSGTCVDPQGCAVTWANAATSGSGTATITGTDWTTNTTSSALTVFLDSFASASNTTLVSHTPDIGTSWTEVEDTAGTNRMEAAATGVVRPVNSGTGTRLLYLATPSPALVGTSYDVSATIASASASSNPVAIGLFAGYADTSNYCGVIWYRVAAAPDLVLFKRVAGVVTTLGTADVSPSAGQAVKLEMRASSMTVRLAGTSVITATDAFCDDATGAGILNGAVYGGSDLVSNGVALDDFTVADQGATGGGIPLNVGLNTITITGTDGGGATGTDVIQVTRVATDTTAPTIQIDTPTTATTWTVNTASFPFGGPTADNVGVSSVAYSCASCTPTSGACTLTGGTAFSCSVTLASGANAITVTATDAATLTGSDSITVTLNTSDITAPTLAITTPATDPYTATATPLTISGTCTDAGSGVQSVSVTCSACAPTTPTVSGTGAWSASLGLTSGQHDVTVTCRDVAGNVTTEPQTVNYTAPLAFATQSLPTAVQNAEYTTCVSASGGTPPYSYTKLTGTYPTGVSFTGATGCFSGTATVVESQALTFRVTDSAGTPATADSGTLTINVVAAGSGPHAFFDSLVARGDHWKSYSLRSQSQIQTYTNGANPNSYVTYSPGTDTDPNAQDAAKIVIPQFTNANNQITVKTQINPGDTTIALNGAGSSSFTAGRGLKINNEIMTVIRSSTRWDLVGCTVANPTVCTTTTAHGLVTGDNVDFANTTGYTPNINTGFYLVTKLSDTTFEANVNITVAGTGGIVLVGFNADRIYVNRAQYGTTAGTHTANTIAAGLSTNSLPGANQVRVPLSTTDGNSYLFTWDGFWTDSFLDRLAAFTNHKAFQFAAVGQNLWLEPNTRFDGGASSVGSCPSWDRTTMVAGVATRAYSGLGGGADWTTTNGNTLGPNVTLAEPLAPMTNKFCIRPNKWVRFWYQIQQVSQDYDILNAWVADEDNDPVQLYTDLQISVRTDGAFPNTIYSFWLEYNTSTDDVTRPNGQNYVMYFRNFAALESAGAPPAGWSSLRVKPVR
jgi:hypothetical protein